MKVRPIPQIAIDLVARYEGFSPTPYVCPAGYLTIGYGHAIRKGEKWDSKDIEISEEEAKVLLKSDMLQAAASVCRYITVPLGDNQYAALISFTFNLGGGALQRSTLRMKLNRMEYLEAAQEFPKWCWAGGRKLRGLLLRRQEEQSLFMEDIVMVE